MAIIDQEIPLYAGESLNLVFTMTPVENVTDWTIVFTVTRALASATKVIEQAATIVSGPAGTFRVPLTSAQTNVPPDTYEYDVWRVDAGSERLLAAGDFVVGASSRVPVSA